MEKLVFGVQFRLHSDEVITELHIWGLENVLEVDDVLFSPFDGERESVESTGYNDFGIDFSLDDFQRGVVSPVDGFQHSIVGHDIHAGSSLLFFDVFLTVFVPRDSRGHRG